MKLVHRSELAPYLKDAKNILDIGGGHKPFPLASVVVDKLPNEVIYAGKIHQENVGAKIKPLSSAKFIQADMTNLSMFKNNEFDFVFCSHVIEHVEDVSKAFSELTRIAPRGYLECPRGWFEYIDGSPFHKWFIDFDGKKKHKK